MNFQIVSDLHVDYAPLDRLEIVAEADALIVAGDVCEGAEKAFKEIRRLMTRDVEVVAVLGNHEFYRRNLRDEEDRAKLTAPRYGIRLLADSSTVLSGVRLVGATFWTDYAIFGASSIQSAMRTARATMNDHKRIEWSHNPWKRFRPEEAALLHHRSRRYIADMLAQPFAGPTVVVSHTGCHPNSIGAQWRNELTTACFVSDCSTEIEAGRPTLWVHGHVHESFDYMVGATRIVCNPRGYGRENLSFDPALVVEVM